MRYNSHDDGLRRIVSHSREENIYHGVLETASTLQRLCSKIYDVVGIRPLMSHNRYHIDVSTFFRLW